MKRQAMTVTVRQLRKLARSLMRQMQNGVEKDYPDKVKIKHQITIINKTGLSDDWEFAKDS